MAGHIAWLSTLHVFDSGEMRLVVLLRLLELPKQGLRYLRWMVIGPQLRHDLTLPLHMGCALANMPLDHL